MSFVVRFVQDQLLPEGHDWMIARDAASTYVFVRESVLGRPSAAMRAGMSAARTLIRPCPVDRPAGTLVLEPAAREWVSRHLADAS